MNTTFPGGFPQNVSFVPNKNLFDRTVSACQFVDVTFVTNSGNNAQLFVPVDLNTMFVPTLTPTIWIVGGGGPADVPGTVTI